MAKHPTPVWLKPFYFKKGVSGNPEGQFIKGHKINVGRKQSEETKRKRGLTIKGIWENKVHPTGMLGKHPTGMLGKHHSVETIEKMRKVCGHLINEETRKKISEALKGEKSYNWKGGITPENQRIRNGIEWRLWRESVFARDNWTCQKCGIRSGQGEKVYFHPHHIQNFSQYPELRTSIENGITLCKNCHWDFHKKYGKQNNTKEQLNEFLKNS